MTRFALRLALCLAVTGAASARAAESAPAAGAREAADPPALDAPLAACFEPGTSQEEMDRVAAKLRGLGVSLESFGPEKSRQVTRWAATATDGGGLTQGTPTTITWSYLPDGYLLPGFAGEPTSPNNMQAWLTGLYGDFDTWHALFVQVFDRWSEKTGLTYVYEPNDDGASFPGTPGLAGVRGDVRIAGHSIPGGILAYNWYPNLGDMVIDSGTGFYSNLSNNSLRLRNVLAHEAGHGIGQGHVVPTNGTKLMEPFINLGFDGPTHDEWIGAQRAYGDQLEDDDDGMDATDLGSTYPPGREVEEAGNDADDEQDWYRIDVLAPDAVNGGELHVELRPVGFTYTEGAQGGSAAPLDTTVLSDLRFELYEADGSTLVVSVDDVAEGGVESLVLPTSAAGGLLLVSGTGVDSFPRAISRPPAAQLYDLSVETRANPVAELGGPYLLECSAANEVMLDGTASFDPDGGGLVSFAWSTTCPGASIADPASATTLLSLLPGPPPCPSTCSVTLTVTDDEGQSWTESLPVTVQDTTAPVIAAGDCAPLVQVVPLGGDCLATLSLPLIGGVDGCDENPTATSDAPALFPRGETLVVHSLTDACGNADSCTQSVLVIGAMDCFAANCSKIDLAEGQSDGRITAQGTLRTCDRDSLYDRLEGSDRVRLVIDGFVAFDQPWSAFAPSGPGHRFKQGAVSFNLKGSQWKFADRASGISEGDISPGDGVLHQLELGPNLGSESRQMVEKRPGRWEACRHGQDRIRCD